MSKKLFLSLFSFSLTILSVGVIFSLAEAQIAAGSPALSSVSASPASGLQFPIAELGNCGSQNECKPYCDNPDHISACSSFAESSGLSTKTQTAFTQKFVAAIKSQTGPGGCSSPDSCKTYCDNISHIDECVSFAEKNGLKTSDQLSEAKKIQQAIKSGATPPGACKNKDECETYCSNSDHLEECLAFSEKAGLMNQDELAQAKKVLPLMKSGQTPGQCKTKNECDTYCQNESNASECADFAVKAGFMNQQEAEIVKKTGGRGPGGCRGEECKTFCDNPENSQTCFEFGKENGLISEDNLRKMEEGQARFKEGLDKAPPAVVECLKSTVGENVLDKIKTGGFLPPRELGDRMKTCFEQNIQKGPGGCDSKESCDAFCSNPDNQETCFGFAEKQGLISSDQIKEIKQGSQSGQGLENVPPEVSSCLKEKLGNAGFQKIQSGSFLPNQKTGSAIQGCFEKFRPDSPEENETGNANGRENNSGGFFNRLFKKTENNNGQNPSPGENNIINGQTPGNMPQNMPGGQGIDGQNMPDGQKINIQNPGAGTTVNCSSPEECQKLFERNKEQIKNRTEQKIEFQEKNMEQLKNNTEKMMPGSGNINYGESQDLKNQMPLNPTINSPFPKGSTSQEGRDFSPFIKGSMPEGGTAISPSSENSSSGGSGMMPANQTPPAATQNGGFTAPPPPSTGGVGEPGASVFSIFLNFLGGGN